jgi:sugar lactone lactonase YvrE
VAGTGNFISRDGAWDTASVGWAGALALLPNGSLALLDSKVGAVRVVSPLLTVTTLAGGGAIIGFVDGIGASARFHPEVINGVSMVFRPSGLVLADAGNRRLRRISVDTGRVDTLAGTGTWGSVDGTTLSATFSWPRSVALDSSGNLYVADGFENVIRRISVTGVVTTLAGKAGQAGSADGFGAEARFSTPHSLVVDSKGNVMVADQGNAVLRRITPDGSVTTLVGKAGEGGFVNGKGAEARLGSVMQMAIDKDDNLYFTEGGFHTVRKVSPSGDVSTLAGAPYSPGSVDDVAPFARFSTPTSLAVDARGNVYVCDTGNGTVRRISPDGYVTTVLGQPGTSVLQLGIGGSLNGPLAIAVSPEGRLFLLSEGAIVGD